MSKEEMQRNNKSETSRRKFLGKFSIGLVGLMAWPLLSKGSLFSRTKNSKVPANLPGPGSIFQPREDDR